MLHSNDGIESSRHLTSQNFSSTIYASPLKQCNHHGDNDITVTGSNKMLLLNVEMFISKKLQINGKKKKKKVNKSFNNFTLDFFFLSF